MFELTTQSVNDINHELYFVYVDENGNIQSTDYKLEIIIDNVAVDRQSIIKNVLEMYNNKMINVRGCSNFEKITGNTLKCKQLTIKTKKSIINKLDSSGAFFGSMKEFVENTIKSEISNVLFSMGQGGNISVVATENVYGENENTLNIIEFNDKGFNIIRGKMTHIFKDDYNASCTTCMEGLKRYVEQLNKINSFVVKNSDAAVFEGEYIVDFTISDDTKITEQIHQTLFPLIEMASIKSIKYERV